MGRSGREIGTGVDIPICCKKHMAMTGSSYEKGEGWRDQYRCLIRARELSAEL